MDSLLAKNLQETPISELAGDTDAQVKGDLEGQQPGAVSTRN